MKASEIIDALYRTSDPVGEVTCDTCKAGSPEREVRKLAVSMFATVNIIREAAAWGADLLIVHEPTYYKHMDEHAEERLEVEKRALLESTGMTVYRYHDHAHREHPDIIVEGEAEAMGLDAVIDDMSGIDRLWMTLRTPTTPREVARQIEKSTGIAHIRICGAADVPCTKITGMFGTPGGVFEELQREGSEIVMTGEACEWMLGEYARDAAQLGYRKALLILGHIGSERDGMKLTARRLAEQYPEIETKYFECGEVYTYTDR